MKLAAALVDGLGQKLSLPMRVRIGHATIIAVQPCSKRISQNMRPICFVLTLAIVSFPTSASSQEAGAFPVLAGLEDVDIQPNWSMFEASSSSMEPTLPRLSYVLAAPAPSPSANLHRGEVVAFDVTMSYPEGPYAQTPGKPKFTFLMRVVGLPNDKVELKRGELMINDVPIAEPYASLFGPSLNVYKSIPAVVVPVDSVYVLGDNRGNSNDSRFSGPVRISFIRGVVKYVLKSQPGSRMADKWHPVK